MDPLDQALAEFRRSVAEYADAPGAEVDLREPPREYYRRAEREAEVRRARMKSSDTETPARWQLRRGSWVAGGLLFLAVTAAISAGVIWGVPFVDRIPGPLGATPTDSLASAPEAPTATAERLAEAADALSVQAEETGDSASRARLRLQAQVLRDSVVSLRAGGSQ